MIDKDLLLKRLSIIKLLYKIGLEQSKQSESISFFSILSFHDSIEMFLKLRAEHKEIKSEKFSFMDYWDSIPELTMKESMKNLNARRVNLKHKGLIPAKIEVETSRVDTGAFFEQNTKSTFDIDFSEISLLELIKFPETKKLLILSQEFLDQEEFEKSVEKVTKGFNELLIEFKENKKKKGHKTDFDFIETISFNKYNSNNEPNKGTDKRVEEVVDEHVHFYRSCFDAILRQYGYHRRSKALGCQY